MTSGSRKRKCGFEPLLLLSISLHAFPLICSQTANSVTQSIVPQPPPLIFSPLSRLRSASFWYWNRSWSSKIAQVVGPVNLPNGSACSPPLSGSASNEDPSWRAAVAKTSESWRARSLLRRSGSCKVLLYDTWTAQTGPPSGWASLKLAQQVLTAWSVSLLQFSWWRWILHRANFRPRLRAPLKKSCITFTFCNRDSEVHASCCPGYNCHAWAQF